MRISVMKLHYCLNFHPIFAFIDFSLLSLALVFSCVSFLSVFFECIRMLKWILFCFSV